MARTNGTWRYSRVTMPIRAANMAYYESNDGTYRGHIVLYHSPPYKRVYVVTVSKRRQEGFTEIYSAPSRSLTSAKRLVRDAIWRNRRATQKRPSGRVKPVEARKKRRA